MTPESIVERISTELDGVVPKSSWGETSLFYNPGRKLPNGVYFCTIKDHDGANDQASRLDREGVFRVAVGLGAERYRQLFGDKPERPPKGGIVETGHDFTELDVLMPHPIYAWMSWAQVLSPSLETLEEVFPDIVIAHSLAKTKFDKKVRSR